MYANDDDDSVSGLATSLIIDLNDYSRQAYEFAVSYVNDAMKRGGRRSKPSKKRSATRRRRSSKRMSRKMNKRRR